MTVQLPTSLPAPAPRARRILAAPALLLALSVACSASLPRGPLGLESGSAREPLPASSPESLPALAVASRVEREIEGTEVQEYALDLPAATYARVVAEQRADVALELRGPDGSTVTRSDGPGSFHAPEQLSWITSVAGRYRLLVTAHDPQAPRGSYGLKLEEVRPAVAGDEALVAAERAGADAYQRGFTEKAEDKRQAVEDLQRVLAVWRAAGDRPREARTLNDVGILQILLTDNTGASASLEEALHLARDLDDRRQCARASGQLGRVQRRTGGDKAGILALYQEALRLWRELGDRTGEADALFNIGVLYADEDDPDTALTFYQQALTVQDAAGLLAPEAFTLAAIGLIARDRGDAARALDCFTRGLDLARRSGDRSVETYLLYSTASFHLRRGELQRAIELFTEARDLYQAQGDRRQEARVLSNLGSANVSLGDLDRAFECYRQALEIHRGLGDRAGELYALLFLGRVLELQGDTAAAIERYSQALSLGRSGSNPIDLARSLYYLGGLDVTLGRAAEGRPLLAEALAIFEDKKSTFDQGSALLELGKAAHSLGDDERARQYMQQALDLGRGLQNFMLEMTVQVALARLELDRNDLSTARSAIEEALRLTDSARSKVASQRLRTLFRASQRAYYELHIEILMRLHEQHPEGDFVPAALAASERARARGLLDLLAEGRIDVRKGIAPDLKQREEEIDSRISALQSQMLDDLSRGGWSAAKAALLDQEMKQAAEDREELDWEVRRRHPRYAAVYNPPPLRLEEIQTRLDSRTALLEYAVGDERSYLFVVTREGLTSYALPPASRLADEVRQIGRSLEKPGRRTFGLYLELARGLYRELLAPAADVLAGKPHLIISPDGPLHFLSFEALLTADSGVGAGYSELPYLIREKSVSYVPSASVLAELSEPREQRETAAAPKRFVGFADALPAAAEEPGKPVELTRSGSFGLANWRRLGQSRREVQGIAGLYPADEELLFFDNSATEENVKDNEALRTARRIHFATHGFINEKQPELSGLVLTHAAGSREDGLLQVYEIFNLELDADLVVLSACDTGLGAMVSGEGLVGVTRALLYAGARSVVVSLWQVDDASTPDLMISFYRHLDHDQNKAESLRLAKLELIAEGRFSHPFYWAPFILIGEPR